MKHLAYLFFFALLFACGNSSENVGTTDFSNLTFTMDTVMVDPGDEIINLYTGLWVSAIHPSGSYLYNWDQKNMVLEKINLDKLMLEEKIPYEKEGPNGVGSFVSWISLTDDDQIVIGNFQDMGLFNFKGEKIKALRLRGEQIEGDLLESNENFSRKSILTSDGNHLYGILGSWSGKSFTLGRMDFNSKTLKKFPLPDYDKLSDYTTILSSSGMQEITVADQYIEQVEDRIIFSTAVFNTLMVYDLNTDSLYKVDYQTTLTKNSKTGKYRNEVESKEEFRQIRSEISQEINFLKPIWDSKNDLFYRFSYESLPATSLPDGSLKYKNKIYLTILDKDFQVLAETLIEELKNPPSTHFVKDGKIWIFENIEDELAFIRLSIL